MAHVPSLRRPELVPDLRVRGWRSRSVWPCKDVVAKVRETEPQRTMQNSQQQYRNVRNAFEITGEVPSGPVLLVDGMVDSRWTLTVVGLLLLEAGAGVGAPVRTGGHGREVSPLRHDDSLATILLVQPPLCRRSAAPQGI